MRNDCTIIAKALEKWNKLILEHGKEKVLDILSEEVDKLISNSDGETAYVTVENFQEPLRLLSFYENFSDEQKERLRNFGWKVFDKKEE